MHYLHKEFHLSGCTKDGQAAFAMALVKRAALTWNDLALSGRKALGWELIPVKQLKMTLPAPFVDQDRVMVMRYDGKKPMAGVRVGDTYHVLAIEAQFNDLYDHGS